jgi:hypothetical protein
MDGGVGVIVCLWCLGFIRHSDDDVMVRLPWQSALVLFFFFPVEVRSSDRIRIL